MIKRMEQEIIQDWSISMRQAIFFYIITDPNEMARLEIKSIPIKYPVIMLRAPVTWHAAKVFANQSISANLHITKDIFLEIRKLWDKS